MKKTVAYLGGTFDLFHVSHVAILQYARDVADMVVVVVNTDRFVLEYKGVRPTIPMDERIAVLAACRYVDVVDINWGGYDSKPAILKHKPDFIIHGDDWTGESYLKQLGVTQEFLTENGIILLFPPRGHQSSSQIRKRINA